MIDKIIEKEERERECVAKNRLCCVCKIPLTKSDYNYICLKCGEEQDVYTKK